MKKINSTVTKGVAKVPVIMQLESLECGAASLAMVLAYYGKWLPLEQVRSDCGVSRDGSKAGHIYKAAQNYGFNVEAYKTTPEQLKKEGRFPCIIHWNMNHFVVLDGFRKGKVYLNDPARGNVTVTWEEFDKAFTGVCIIPVPGENFKPEGKPKSTLEFARKRLKGAGAALIFMIITTALAYLFGILNSVTSRVYMDRILPGTNENWFYPFMLLLVAIAVIQIAVELAQTIYTLRVNGKMDAIGSCSYMWKVLRLPMDFFSQRLAGDIKNRLTENASIAQTLIQTFAPLLLNSVMMVFYLVLMLRQSTPLTMIGLATLVVNFIMSRVISKKRVNIARVAMRDTGQLSSATLTGIDMIETIKASGAEAGFFKKWSGYQASVNSADIDTKKTTYYLGIVPTFASMTAKYIVFYIGIYLTMKGNFTLGTVMMFQGFLSSFMDPAMAFVAAGQHIQEMRTQMERVEDVMEYPDDAIFNESDISDDEIIGKLSGNIEINDITFGYSKLEPPLIKNFSLNIKTGERVAIVGASGSGKSTIAKLVSGLYQPQSGSILFDGKASYEYPRDVVTSSVAVVDQDITLFEGTILDNIRMWDESIKDFDVILAARDAKLHDAILLKRGGYRHVLSSGGKELSGGQRQRMEIARALALDPTIIILDEATSALDAKTEHEVVEAISRRGITCIVVAHRLSAVRDCDRIIVLDHGDVVETGTHDELMAKRTAYYELVSSE